jgi:hypothetical protein
LFQGAFGIQSLSIVLQPVAAASMTNAESRTLVVMEISLFDRFSSRPDQGFAQFRRQRCLSSCRNCEDLFRPTCSSCSRPHG